MKNLIFLLLLPLLLGACTSEIEDIKLDPNNNTNIEITIPLPDDLRTRGFSDGNCIDNLKCYVYGRAKADDADPLFIEDIVLKNYSDHIGSLYSLYLPKGQAYDLVFFATCGSHDDPDGKLYYNKKSRIITVDYNSSVLNDETLDCFFGSILNVSPENGDSYSVTLKRPFGQLNIGTKDIALYNEMSSSPLKSVAVSVDGVYSSFSAMDGSLKGGVSKLNFPQAERPASQVFPVSGNDYLSMNYLLVNEQKKVNVKLTVQNQTSSFDCDFSQIPLQRNCQTNIYGNLLTKSNDFKVEVSNIFSGHDESYIGYDLIITLANTTAPAELYYKETAYSAYKKIDLSPYIDGNRKIKVSWEQLGLKSAYSITFVPLDQYGHFNFFTKVPPSIETVDKFNYQDIGLQSFNRLFYACRDLKYVNLENWDTSGIVDMQYMFFECNAIESLDLSNFDTSKVISMGEMFSTCINLKSLDLTNFNTSNVTSMEAMFSSCYLLESIDVSSFDTSNVTTMRHMFSSCESLTSLNLSNFNTTKVTNMVSMFRYCTSLQYLNISSFDLNGTNIASWLDYCPATVIYP